jgi:hypothetical protein
VSKKQLEMRLNQLKTEYDAGQKMLAELQSKETTLKQTLGRISQAIKEIEEQLKPLK